MCVIKAKNTRLALNRPAAGHDCALSEVPINGVVGCKSNRGKISNGQLRSNKEYDATTRRRHWLHMENE